MAAKEIIPPFIRTEFLLEAIFEHQKGGETKFKDIVGISATFALNDIPTASLEVATGLEVHDETKATIHDALKKLKPRDKVKVWLTLKSTEGYLNEPIISGMKDGRFIIFEGYYSGIGYHRSYNNCTYTIHLVHWLDDLNCSSMLNGDWSPNLPSDLAQAASILAVSDLSGGTGTDVGGSGHSGPGARAVPMIDREEPPGNELIVTTENLTEDLWEKVVKKILLNLTNFRHPLTQCDMVPDGGEDKDGDKKPHDNQKAAANALKRIPGEAPDKYKATLPLNLTGFEGGDEATFISLSVHEGLCRLILEGMGHNSFWSKLVGEIAPSFLFAISPSVTFAQAIPFFPALNTPYITIEGEEYNYANFNANARNILSRVVIQWAAQSEAGQEIHGGNIAPMLGYCYPAGHYPKENQDHWGNILVRDPPSWLCNRVYHMMYSKSNTLDPNAGSTAAPQEGEDPNPEGPSKHRDIDKKFKDKKDDIDDAKLNIYDRFACHWYKSAILGQRYGELSGKLRFDIAPGSIVKIIPPVRAIGDENTPMYGAVVSVSFVINSEQHTAGTSFSFSHMRTEEENNINDPHSKKHFVGTIAPVYYKREPGSPWEGGPLVKGQEPS